MQTLTCVCNHWIRGRENNRWSSWATNSSERFSSLGTRRRLGEMYHLHLTPPQPWPEAVLSQVQTKSVISSLFTIKQWTHIVRGWFDDLGFEKICVASYACNKLEASLSVKRGKFFHSISNFKQKHNKNHDESRARKSLDFFLHGHNEA